MKKYLLILLTLCPFFSYSQFSEALLNKIRYATDEYYIARDTLMITGSPTLPCLDIMINGRGPYRFLIDLGSNVLNFKRSVVEDAGMDVIVDRARGDIAVARSLQIGESVFLSVHGAVYDELDVDGVLGFNLIGKSNFVMDYPNMKFAFISTPDAEPDSSWLSYELLERMPYLRSKVGQKEVLINFDTGAAGNLYFPMHWKDSLHFQATIAKGKVMYNNQTGYAQTYTGQLTENVYFGKQLIPSPKIVLDPDIEDVFVGSAFLKDFKLTFIPSQKLVKMDEK